MSTSETTGFRHLTFAIMKNHAAAEALAPIAYEVVPDADYMNASMTSFDRLYELWIEASLAATCAWTSSGPS